MTFRIYDNLCEDAKQIRTEVFVAEQGFETEFDDTDSKARHIVGYDGEKPVAVCRYFYDEEHKAGQPSLKNAEACITATRYYPLQSR